MIHLVAAWTCCSVGRPLYLLLHLVDLQSGSLDLWWRPLALAPSGGGSLDRNEGIVEVLET